MDELIQYLKSYSYEKSKLEYILNKKIIITKNHIDNIKIIFCCDQKFNIIKIFEKYGYIFTNDDYIMLVNKCGFAIQFIPEDKQTNKICKTAVQQNGFALEFVPEDKKTDEIYKIAVKQCKNAFNFVPDNKKYLFIKNETNNI